jgi:hypothetical protein
MKDLITGGSVLDPHKRGGRQKGTKNKIKDPDQPPRRRWGNPPPPKKHISRPPAIYDNDSVFFRHQELLHY